MFYKFFKIFQKSSMSTYIIDLISHLTLRKIGLTKIKTQSPPMVQRKAYDYENTQITDIATASPAQVSPSLTYSLVENRVWARE